jgi:predicted anti-sigma-YlaC factor YlaD
MSRARGIVRRAALGAALAAVLGACSVRRLAVGALGGALAESGAVFASDDDPELVREALPFALKSIEALIVQAPEDERLLLAACSGFTQYAKGFVEADAERAADEDWARALELRARAHRLYARARDYGLRALALRHPTLADELRSDPRGAVRALRAEDVAPAFWTGAAWGSAIASALDRPEVVVDLDAARALLERAIELDADHERGRLHEALISLEALPEMMGGSPHRAREHFLRAVELSGGRSPGPYVTFASAVSLPAQERAEFERLLETALAIDPDAVPEDRLACVLAQRRARELLARADELFLEPLPEDEGRGAGAHAGRPGSTDLE